MKYWGGLVLFVALMGCDFTVPISSTPETPWDAGAVGLWEQEGGDGAPARLVILPLDSRQLLVAFPVASPDTLYANAFLCTNLPGLPLYQIEWIGSNRGLPATNRLVQLAAATLRDNTLEVRIVDSQTLGSNIQTSEELRLRLIHAKDAETLFRQPLRFRKVAASSP